MENFNKNVPRPQHIHHHHPHPPPHPHPRFQGHPQQQHANRNMAPALMRPGGPLPPFQQIAQASRQSPPPAYHELAMAGHQHQQQTEATVNAVNDNNTVTLTAGKNNNDENNARVIMCGGGGGGGGAAAASALALPAPAYFDPANSGGHDQDVYHEFGNINMDQGFQIFFHAWKKAENDIAKERNHYHQQLQMMNANYNNIKSELDNSKANFMNLQAIVNQSKKNEEKYKRKIHTLSQQNEKLMEDEKTTAMDMTTMRAEIDQLKVDLKTVTAERDQAKKEKFKTTEHINEMAQERIRLMTEKDKEKSKSDNLTAQVEKLKQTLEEKERDILHVREQWADCQKNLGATEDTLKMTKITLEKATRMIEELQEINSGLENDLRFEKGSVENLMQHVKNSQCQLKAAKRKIQWQDMNSVKLQKSLNGFEVLFKSAWTVLREPNDVDLGYDEEVEKTLNRVFRDDQDPGQGQGQGPGQVEDDHEDYDENNNANANLSEQEHDYLEKMTRKIFINVCGGESGDEFNPEEPVDEFNPESQDEDSSSEAASDSDYSMPALERFENDPVTMSDLTENIPPQDMNENENDSTSNTESRKRSRSGSGSGSENLSVKISRKGSPKAEWKITDI